MNTPLDLKELQKHSTLNAACVLIDWSELEKFSISIEERPDVATRLWVTITFTRESEEFQVSGSSVQIAKNRFFELVNKF